MKMKEQALAVEKMSKHIEIDRFIAGGI